MTELENFSRSAAKRYLQNIVFVDDEIYLRASGQPAVVTSDIAPLVSPFGAVAVADAEPTGEVAQLEEEPAEEAKVPYHPKDLVQSFAREGMVCALYEPTEGFETSTGSELFKLCERADVVILDWDLFGEDGRNITPLISNLVNESQTSVPHHSRLGVVYTTKPDLLRVANTIFEALRADHLTVEIDENSTTLKAGATRFIVLGKPNVPGRTEEAKVLEVAEEDLATRVIDEFAKMHRGILPSYALYGMSSVRRNSKKILDKFDQEMDGAFLLHRALLLKNEDAFEQLPELIAEEVLAVMLDDQVSSETAAEIAQEVARSFPFDRMAWQVNPGRPARRAGELAQMYLGGGARAVEDEYTIPKKGIPVRDFHTAMGCDDTHAQKRLAALFNLRTRYSKSKPPVLGFGTIVRWGGDAGQDAQYTYALCLMPLCDSIRLKSGGDVRTPFPFWTLRPTSGGNTPRGIVVKTLEDQYVELYVTGKPRDMLWIDRFAPSDVGMVVAEQDGARFVFSGSEKRVEWVAQLKPSHAQRAANDIGNSFSRVGVVEAEWLRLITDG